MTPEKHEAGKETMVSTLAGFAKEVVAELRGKADVEMDSLRGKKLEKVEDSLQEVEHLFSGETDRVQNKSELALGVDQAKALVNLVRSVLGMTPLGEDEDVDLSRDLDVDEKKGTVLHTGGKEVRYADLDFSRFKNVGERLIKSGESAILFKERLDAKSCWDWIKGVYDKAGIEMGKVVYQNTLNGKAGQGEFNPSYLVPGAWIYFVNGNSSQGDAPRQHSALLKDFDSSTGMATVLSYTGGTQGTPREHKVKLTFPPANGQDVPNLLDYGKNETLPQGVMGMITHIRLPGEPKQHAQV